MPQRLSDVPMADLVPETREWNDGTGIALDDWIGCIGSVEHAIAYGEMFINSSDTYEHHFCCKTTRLFARELGSGDSTQVHGGHGRSNRGSSF